MKFKLFVIGLVCVLTACGGATATSPAAPTNASQPTNASVPPTAAPAEAPTETATTAPAPVQATATSSGPLAAQIFVANCRSAPTADKPGNVNVQISVEATGGNGVYTYVYNDVAGTNKFIDIAWELGSRLTGTVTVNSGDGQTVDVQLNVDLKEIDCP